MSGAVTGDGGRRLLGTKLHAPRGRRQLVARDRLTDRLVDAQRPVMTLVSAPAGFGKTTLLADWIDRRQRSGLSTAWLSLDAGDSDPVRFVGYFVAAMARIAPIAATQAAADDGQPLQAVATVLLDELDEIDDDVAIVLDDYHTIGGTEIHDAITFLVDHAPACFRVVVATRSDPPLPLARWRVRGDLLELRASDLRFTTDEASAYMRDSMSLDLTSAEVGALEARTEGWIAALQLAALSLQGCDDPAAFIETFAGDDRFVLDYLAQEVLERQPDAVRQFLLDTSILERLSGPLCDAVTGTARSKSMLEYLDRSNLFLVRLDDRRHWFRYHHLFADVLRSRLLDDDPERVAQLHQRASDWCHAHSEPSEAIRHALACGQAERAAQIIELAAPAMRQSRQEGTLRRWLEALPVGVFSDRPVLAISLVGARMATGDTTGAEVLLDLVEATLARASPPPIVYDRELFDRLSAQVAIQRAGLALLGNQIAQTVAHATRALGLVDADDHYRRASATALLALAHWSAGELDTAVRRYDEAIASFIAADHLADALGCSLALADIQIVQGKLSDATRTFEAGLRLTEDRPNVRGAADMHVGLSEVLLERNLLDEATEHLETSIHLGDGAGLPQHAYRRRVVMARLCRARGDLDRALELIDQAAPIYDTDYSPPVRTVAAMRVRVQLARGELDAARRWATTAGITSGDDPSYVREYEHLTLARVLIAGAGAADPGADLDTVIGLLARLHDAALCGGRIGSALEALILKAAASQAAGDIDAATTALAEALERSAAEGHIRLFLHAGSDLAALLHSVASRSAPTPHVRRVLEAIDYRAIPRTTPSPSGLVTPLSPREHQVLRLLRSELSGPDIARELHVSLNTLRTHTKSIFTKLGATSRREALRRATELGV